MKKLILIGGGTASGKTLLLKQIFEQYRQTGKECSMLSMDNYYKDLDALGAKEHSEVNWDEPKAFDWGLLRSDIDDLLNDKRIICHKYNYETGFHSKEEIKIESSDFIVLEGLFALYDEEIKEKAEIKIFVDADSDVRMLRRIKRDKERRYSKTFDYDKFITQWEEVTKPMHKLYIQPTMQFADIILRNNKRLNPKEKSSLITLLQTIVVK